MSRSAGANPAINRVKVAFAGIGEYVSVVEGHTTLVGQRLIFSFPSLPSQTILAGIITIVPEENEYGSTRAFSLRLEDPEGQAFHESEHRVTFVPPQEQYGISSVQLMFILAGVTIEKVGRYRMQLILEGDIFFDHEFSVVIKS